ncbi:MAG: lipoate--protein ligase [Clostridia bacterium]|nr:lipoate--protein ligase [Clostridia bacterium]
MNRIIVSEIGDGFFNLALDGFLLEKHRSGELSGVTLYFFVNSDAVIVGRNQNAWRECDVERMEKDGVQLVRRHTGGGAVYHDRGNLNFSFITDEKLYDKDKQNAVVLSALASLGIDAEVNGRNDVTVGGYKISGCAYALSGTARGMHGTLLIDTDTERLGAYLTPSAAKLEAKGIKSVRSRVKNLAEIAPVTVETVRDAIIDAFEKAYGDCEKPAFVRSHSDPCLTPHEAFEREYEKQRSWEWRMGKTPAFDHTLEGRLSFGEFGLALRIKDGRIASSELCTDALDTTLPSEITGLLSGVRFDRASMIAALERGGAAARELAGYIREKGEAMLTEKEKELIISARRALHAAPELSGRETRTKEYLISFIKKNTSLAVHDMGAWFYAKYDEGADRTVAVRADIDAVCVEGAARHLCGHDGHSASLLGLAMLLGKRPIGRNVILLFQHAEETGAGAKECLKLFDLEKVDAVIGCHNIPGRPMGTALIKGGTFACASCGMDISLSGKPTHAAYPENGLNPSEALALLTLKAGELANKTAEKHACMTLSTVVGMRAGERAFGVAASEASLWLTLRSEKTEALDELILRMKEYASLIAKEKGLALEIKLEDVFPATVNDGALLEKAERLFKKELIDYAYLDEPFRWSEDFGHYLKRAPAFFFGVGSGEDTAPLHTERYSYPDELAPLTAELMYKLAKGS